jgi:SNF2 family DNA or RNA helicase
MESDSGDSSRKRSREPSDSPLHVTISESPELTIIDLTSLGIDPEEIRQQKELEERFSKRHRLQTEQDAAFAQLLYKQINGHEDIEAERERQRQRESQQESLRLELDRRRELARKLQQGEERSAEIERERALERERERQIEKDITYENISSIVSLAQQAKTEGSSSTGSPINITAGSSSASVSAISTPPTGSEGSSPTSYDDFIDLTAEDEHLARQLQDQELTILDNHLIGSNASTPLVISSKSSLSALASSSNRQHWAYGSYIRGAQESKGKEAFSDFASDIQKALDEGYYIKLDDDLLMKAQSYSSSTAALNDINQIMRQFDNLSHTANTTPYPAESSRAEKSKHISRHAAERQLRALLKTIENDKAVEVLDRTGTPMGLIPPLMDHQVTGLQWLHKMEENTNKGGILADDMGLGKVIEILLMLQWQ